MRARDDFLGPGAKLVPVEVQSEHWFVSYRYTQSQCWRLSDDGKVVL